MDAKNTKQETELTPKEIRQVKRYCIFPNLVLPAILGALVMPFVELLLSMINDIALNAQEDHTTGVFYIMIGIAVVLIGIYAYGFLGPRSGMKRKKWQQILRKVTVAQNPVTGDDVIVSGVGLANVGRLMGESDNNIVSAAGTAAQIAGSIETMAAVGKQMDQVKENALAVARMSGIKIPSVRKYQLMLFLLPSLIISILYIPIFRKSVLDNRQMNETIAIRMEQLEEVMQDDFIVALKDDPYHRKSDRCNIRFEGKNDAANPVLDVTFAEKGNIESINWSIDEDNTLSREENIRRISEFINISGAKILSTDIPLWLEPPENFLFIPDPMIQEFLQTPENEELSSFFQQDDTSHFLSRLILNSSSFPNELHYSLDVRIRG